MLKNNVFDYFEQNYKRTPNKTALVLGDKHFSYQELYNEIKTVSYHLKNIGVKKGSNVVLFANNTIEFVVILLSCAYLGVIIIPLPLSLKSNNQINALKHIDEPFIVGWFSIVASIVSSNSSMKNKCVSLGRKVDNCYFYDDFIKEENIDFKVDYSVPIDADYIVTMTSGSTGSPKPIVFTHETKINRIFKATKNIYNLDCDDVVLVSTPLYHSLAQRSLLLPLLIGGTAVVLGKFNVKKWLEGVYYHKVSFLFSVSSQLESIANELEHENSFQFDSLKTIVSSSALLRKNIKEKLLTIFNCKIHECYGASEVGVVSDFIMDGNSNKLGSVGKALPFVDIKIKDGEITCRTETSFKGYLKKNQSIERGLDENGYFHTGDLGYLDGEGYLYYLGRKKELIITGGVNIYPSDIETILNDINGVRGSAVIGVEDSSLGQVICAVIEADKTISIGSIQRVCLMELTDYQQPKYYKVVEKLPRSGLGKIMKGKIMKMIDL